MKQARPVYLNLWRIRLPIPGIVSILHRISGVIIFLGLPYLLYLLNLSLHSPETFNQLSMQLSNPGQKLWLWIILSAVAWHFFAGIRHLLMDAGVGESLRGGRAGAWIVIVLSAIVIILLGIGIWS